MIEIPILTHIAERMQQSKWVMHFGNIRVSPMRLNPDQSDKPGQTLYYLEDGKMQQIPPGTEGLLIDFLPDGNTEPAQSVAEKIRVLRIGVRDAIHLIKAIPRKRRLKTKKFLFGMSNPTMINFAVKNLNFHSASFSPMPTILSSSENHWLCVTTEKSTPFFTRITKKAKKTSKKTFKKKTHIILFSLSFFL